MRIWEIISESVSEELVQIEYWQQETMESGRWVKTKPMPRDTAEKIVNSFERGEIVDVDQGVAEGSEERWLIKIWDGYSTREIERKGSYEQIANSLVGLPHSHIWSIEPIGQQRVAEDELGEAKRKRKAKSKRRSSSPNRSPVPRFYGAWGWGGDGEGDGGGE